MTTATTPLIGSSNLIKLTHLQQQQQQTHHQTQQQQQKISIEDFLTTQQTSSFAVKTEPTTTTATTTSRPANIVANRSSLGENFVVDKQAEKNRGKEDIKRGISYFKIELNFI